MCTNKLDDRPCYEKWVAILAKSFVLKRLRLKTFEENGHQIMKALLMTVTQHTWTLERDRRRQRWHQPTRTRSPAHAHKQPQSASLITARGSDGSSVFSIVAVFWFPCFSVSLIFCYHNNLRTATLSLINFCTGMCLGNLKKPIKYQSEGHVGFCAFLFARYSPAVLRFEQRFY